MVITTSIIPRGPHVLVCCYHQLLQVGRVAINVVTPAAYRLSLMESVPFPCHRSSAYFRNHSSWTRPSPQSTLRRLVHFGDLFGTHALSEPVGRNLPGELPPHLSPTRPPEIVFFSAAHHRTCSCTFGRGRGQRTAPVSAYQSSSGTQKHKF
uniref:(northern house mosquito) hypothetical protein n=2 Tax=Culex pipiens TaxID=7175 RepID=A0A8D8LDL9_CULPI